MTLLWGGPPGPQADPLVGLSFRASNQPNSFWRLGLRPPEIRPAINVTGLKHFGGYKPQKSPDRQEPKATTSVTAFKRFGGYI